MRALRAVCPSIYGPVSPSSLAPRISCSRLLQRAAFGHIASSVLDFMKSCFAFCMKGGFRENNRRDLAERRQR